MKTLLTTVTLICICSILLAQNKLYQSPEDSRFITSDIKNFWKAFDEAKDKNKEEQLRIYQKLYIAQASKGFKSWLEKRNKSVEELVDGINQMLPFYESIRENTLIINQLEKEVRAGFYALEYLYPKANFPNVYYFIWYFFQTGSTTTNMGLMIAAETQSVAPTTPLDAIPSIHREMVESMNLSRMPSLVVHESIHEQQDYEVKNLLDKAIKEGACDFIAELCTGQNPSRVVHDYANAKEEELWIEFKEKMYTNDYTGWTGIPQDRPAGLAYWMGYKIVEDYYNKQPNKKKAIETIIKAKSYKKIFDASGYANKFE